MWKSVRNHLRCQDGNVASLLALAIVPVAICAGAATDYLGSYDVRTGLQGAADAAALAAAASPLENERAKAALAHEYFKSKPELARFTPDVKVNDGAVTVSIASTFQTSFLSLAGIESLPVNVTSTATVVTKPICLLSLNKTEARSLRLWGSSARVVANDCVVHSNSTSASALANNSSATSTADVFCSVGGYQGSGFDPVPRTSCRPAKDPYASLPMPDVAGCDQNGFNASGGIVDVEPGVYCGGLSIGQATVRFAPGVYVMKNGSFRISGSNARVAGEGVTIYLYGNGSTVTIAGGSSITLKASDAGDYAGLLFVQDPNSSAGQSSTIMGSSNVELVGVGYFPTQTLSVGGSGNFGVKSPYMAFVADKLEFFGNGKITINLDPKAAGFGHAIPLEFWGTRLTD